MCLFRMSILRRPLNSSLKIKFPFSSHQLSWSRDPFRFLIPAAVGMSGKFYMKTFQHWRAHNEEALARLVLEPRDHGLITFGNHQCFIDDSFIWTRTAGVEVNTLVNLDQI